MLDSLAAAAGIILPVFGIIGMGWLASRTGLLDRTVGDALSDFVYYIAIPMLLFRTIATLEPPDVSPLPFLASFFGGVAVTWAIGSILTRRVFGRDNRAAVIGGVAASFSNIGLVGLPFTLIAFGPEGGVPILFLLSAQMPILMTTGTLMVERAERLDGAVQTPFSVAAVAKRIALNIVRNPIVIGIAVGGAWRLSGLPLTGVPQAMTDMMAASAVGCALFALGMGLTRYQLAGNLKPAITIGAVKLVLLPAIVWLLAAHVADLPPLWVAVAVMAAACPTGVNAWLIASRFNTGLALSANIITLTTAVSVVTMGVWLLIIAP